jgi:hypothetical protein
MRQFPSDFADEASDITFHVARHHLLACGLNFPDGRGALIGAGLAGERVKLELWRVGGQG